VCFFQIFVRPPADAICKPASCKNGHQPYFFINTKMCSSPAYSRKKKVLLCKQAFVDEVNPTIK
jgi:hypothetical protein